MLKYDNPVIQFFRKTLDVLLASLLWIVTVIPVLTLGPACSALYRTIVDVVQNENGKIVPTFWANFRQNLGKGILVTIIHFAIFLFLFGYCYLCMILPQRTILDSICKIAAFLLTAVFLAVSGYLYPLFSHFDFGCFQYFAASAYLSVRHIKNTLVLVLAPFVLSLLLFLNPLFWLLYPGLMAYVSASLLESVFREYIEENSEDKQA